MHFIIGSIKCYFCNKKAGIMESVHKYGIYDTDVGSRIFYHSECLEIIERDPERSGPLDVDKAINISELRKKNREYNLEIIPEYNEKIQELKSNNFERMLNK